VEEGRLTKKSKVSHFFSIQAEKAILEGDFNYKRTLKLKANLQP
jgi:hypothetical protein